MIKFPIGARARVGVFVAAVCAALCLIASPARAARPDRGFARIHDRLLALGQPMPHTQAGPRAHRRRLHLSPVQRAFHIGRNPGRRTPPTTQATSSGTVGLNESPLAYAAPSRRDLILPSAERLRVDERAGRRASRAPPLLAIS